MIEQICIAGGSQRGIAYLGSLFALEELQLLNKQSLKKVIGTSIGTLVLTLYLLSDKTLKEIMNDIFKLDISEFKDITLHNELSILEGHNFRNWVRSLIKDNITLLQFYEKTNVHCSITTVSLTSGLVYMDHITKPNVCLLDAIIASMNLPLIFPPYEIEGELYIDGCVLDDFSTNLLDSEKKCLGLHLKSNKNETIEINGMISYLNKIIDVLKDESKKFRKKTENIIIISIDTSDNNLVDFNITNDTKITLFMRGYNAIMENKDLLEKLRIQKIETPNEKIIELSEECQLKSVNGQPIEKVDVEEPH